MTNPNRLYHILYPNHALIASQLTPTQLAEHYFTGSSKYFDSKIIFVEVDSTFRHPYFDIDGVFKQIKPHPDGRPKATKFICSYRVLEHLDLNAIGNMYLCTPEGHVLELKQAEDNIVHKSGFIRTFANISPLLMLILTKQNAQEYGKGITSDIHKGAPKTFFTQIELDTEAFLENLEKDMYLTSPIPFVHPSKLRDALLGLKNNPEKEGKGLSLNSDFGRMSYQMVRHGFWISSADKTIYFPIPKATDIEKTNFAFLKSMK